MLKTGKSKGALITCIISTILVCIVFWPEVKHLNSTFFSNAYDGLMGYYGHQYFIKYDASYFRSAAFNYPYGETCRYSGIQWLPAIGFKFITQHFYDVSRYWIGFQNAMMLSSIIIAAIFLFLIFDLLDIPRFISSAFAVAISFLSPQILRFEGHFSLAYVFVIPLIIYLLMRFYQKHSKWLTFFIALMSFWCFSTHVYLFFMTAILIAGYWLNWVIESKRAGKEILIGFIHFFIQLVLPFLLVQLLFRDALHITDRTTHPSGFLTYRAYLETVFLPFNESYGTCFKNIFDPIHQKWEGYVYVGIVALIGCIALLIRIVHRFVKFKFSQVLKVTDIPLLNVFFLFSLLALIYSFGIPFIFNENLINHIGPLKQMRGIGRFAWLFYYTLNIVVVYNLWKWSQQRKYAKYVMIIALVVMVSEAISHAKYNSRILNNKISVISDWRNKFEENNWCNTINFSTFQASIVLPYYHQGSENIWINARCRALLNSYIVGVKTGLPTFNIYLGRTSLKQTFENVQLVLEPYRPLQVLSKCPNRKPLLLVVSTCDSFSKAEKNLIASSKFIANGDSFKLYSLPYEILRHQADSLYPLIESEYKMKIVSGFIQEDGIYVENFDSTATQKAYLGKGCFEAGEIADWNQLFCKKIKNAKENAPYTISFWFGNISSDIQLRTKLVIVFKDNNGRADEEIWLEAQQLIKIIDGQWALCEYSLPLKFPKDNLILTFKSYDKKNQPLLIDELLIRPSQMDYYKLLDSGIIKNNRFYPKIGHHD